MKPNPLEQIGTGPHKPKRNEPIPFRYILPLGDQIGRGDIIDVDGAPFMVRTLDKVEFDPRGYIIVTGKGRELEC